jgi:Holliday junction DNA helicase RuvA
VIREDGWTLYGFETRQERELFRELVAVNGVGPQMGLALLGEMSVEELVQAIVEGDTRRLIQAPGVGKRTAERLSLELRQKLLDRHDLLMEAPGIAVALNGGEAAGFAGGFKADELQGTLTAMGYDSREIHSALRAVAAQGLDPAADGERWLGDCLRWLSRSAA